MTDFAINPFTYLVQVTTQAPAATAAPGRLPANSRPLEALLQLLDEHPTLSTPQLSQATGLHSRLVWGLMKGPRQRGQVTYREGQWALNREYQFTAAVALGLRTLGLEGAGRRMRNLDAEALARLTQAERRAVATFLRDVAGRISWEGEPCGH